MASSFDKCDCDLKNSYDICDTANVQLMARLRKRAYLGVVSTIISFTFGLLMFEILVLVLTTRNPQIITRNISVSSLPRQEFPQKIYDNFSRNELFLIAPLPKTDCSDHFVRTFSTFTAHYNESGLTIIRGGKNITLSKPDVNKFITFVDACILCMPTLSCTQKSRPIAVSKLFIPRFTKCVTPTTCVISSAQLSCDELLRTLQLVKWCLMARQNPLQPLKL